MLHKFRLFDPTKNPAEPSDDGDGKVFDMRWWTWEEAMWMGDNLSDFVRHKTRIVETSTYMIDRNEKEIYEGDVVRGIENWQGWDHTGVVEYCKTKGAYFLVVPGEEVDPYPVTLYEYDSLEVLGNIHDNSDIKLTITYHDED